MLTITKLSNNNVEVTGGSQAYTLLPSMHVFRDSSNIDGVRVVSDGNIQDVFSHTKVVEVVRQDGTVVTISDGDTLYNELRDNFFYISSDTEGITSGWELYLETNTQYPIVPPSDIILKGWNSYTNYVTYSNTFHHNDGDWAKLSGGRITANKTIADPLGGTTASTLQFRYASAVSGIFQVGTAFTNTKVIKVWAKSNDVIGKGFSLRVDGTNAPQTSPDFTTSATWQEFEFEVTGNGTSPVNIYIVNESAAIDGYIDIWRCRFYDKENPSEYIETTSTIVDNEVYIEDLGNPGYDTLGNVITRPLLVDGYNFNRNTTELDTIILDRTVAGSDALWVKRVSGTLPLVIAGDDVMEMRINANELLEVEFNGVTLVSNQIISKDVWYYVDFNQDGATNGSIYIGKENVSPVLNAYGTVGAALAATTVMKFGQ